ncbi:hypothetical protein COPCOM_00896 [Coprococcus comes ATCC 27758]|uniref:Uncharacterized protein n=1 Tax=Coprococcus comes ATCC 27758 TaxID=470146 RepID=C0B6X5_9FIRM|nr:hypothetical protein COPCOM_00896 [Coprococcus comes ATCC 27758]
MALATPDWRLCRTVIFKLHTTPYFYPNTRFNEKPKWLAGCYKFS